MKRIPAHFRKLALLVALGLLVTPVLAQGPRGPGYGHGPGHCDDSNAPRHERMFDRLDLTEEQQAEIETLLADHREATGDRAQQMRERRAEMRELIHADAVDESAIRDAAAAVAQAEADLAIERAKLRERIHAVLTPEQIEKAESLRERHRELMRDGRRGSRGGGRHRHRGWHGHPGSDQQEELDD